MGIKPTWGRVSRHGIVDLAASLDHVGPMTRSVRDAAVVLGAIAGADRRDPTCLRAPVPDYAAELGRGLAGIRVGVDESYCTDGTDPAMAQAVLAAAPVLREAGASLHEVQVPDLEPAFAAWGTIGTADIALAHAEYFPARADDYGPQLRGFLEAGLRVSGVDYARAEQQRAAFKAALAELFEAIDVLLCPAVAVRIPAGADPSAPGSPAAGAAVGRFTLPFDVSGSPTVTLPCGFLDDTLPIGLQLVGRPLEEALLCRVAHVYERATGWHRRHPVP